MSDRRSLGQTEGTFGGEFQDQAFEPRSSFDFEDEFPYLQNNMTSADAFEAEQMDFQFPDGIHDEAIDENIFGCQPGSYPMGTNTFDPDMSLVGPTNGWQSMNPSQLNLRMAGRLGVQPTPKSAQMDIVSSRPDHVRQHFGQVTPPNDNTPENPDGEPSKTESNPLKRQDEDIAKLHRTERARNAANKRHAKSKKVKKDSGQENANDGTEEEDDQRKNTSLQREKNRIAAAKCRAKKKATSEEMQENHRDGSRTNSFLQREMRELRDQKALLRNTLLQHEPGMCNCHAIHQYNMMQAQKLAFGVGAMSGQPLSPSQESASSSQTAGSGASARMSFSVDGPSPTTGRVDISSRRQSLGNSLGHGLRQEMLPEGVLGQQDGSMDPSKMPQHFSEFLQNSPGGRAGFS